jgi:tellurite resistance protein TerC
LSLETVGSPLAWGGFLALVLALLALDLGVFHRKSHAVGMREAAIWSVVWVALSALFALGVYHAYGADRALEFTTGYLLEKALAVDNLFVFVLVFQAFAIPAQYQHRILFWGVLGALIMRAVFILAGGVFLQKFHFAIYVFGGILAITGVKLLVQRNAPMHPERNPLVRAFQRLFPTTTSMAHGKHFIVRENGRRVATPLLVALVAIEVADLVFSVDSIPAIFAITRDPFVVFTSNILAILGLRSLYFLLAGIIERFVYLKVGLSFLLIFVGVKMLATEIYKLPILLSLGIIAGILGISVVASLWRGKAQPAVVPESGA